MAAPKKTPSTTPTRPVQGVQFPLDDSGQRSTSSFGRHVVGSALSGVDAAAAAAARAERDWRSGYLTHFAHLVSSGLSTPEAATTVARQGLDSVLNGMEWVAADGGAHSLAQLDPHGTFETHSTSGTAQPVAELVVPVGGRELTGPALEEQLDAWVARGSMEPSAAASIRAVAAHPEWLSLPGRALVALGAGAEVGPLSVFLDWGATVVALDLPRPQIWDRLESLVRASAGTLVAPVRGDGALGVDLLAELPAVMGWLNQLDVETPVLGNFLYADGGTNVRVAAAGHALASAVQQARPGATLGFLATPTDVFAVPEAAVRASQARWSGRPGWSKGVGSALGAVSGGRLIQPNYRSTRTPEVVDSLVPQQGPNYALGKRIHRWQATAQWAAGTPVSMNVAPSTRTRSVTKNKALAAAYAGAHHYGVEVFAPDTTRVLMAALLVHDLYGTTPEFSHPWELEAHQATHGGLWRVAYAPRSALTLAAVLGAPGLLRRS